MRALVVVALVSCGPLEPAPVATLGDPTPELVELSAFVAMGVDSAPPLPPPPLPGAKEEVGHLPAAPPGRLIAAIHAAPIAAIAVTDDGHAAVSADHTGSARVWPTLDGTREPVMLAMSSPVQLAMTRDGGMFAIAGIDHVGQLEIVRTTADGEPVARGPVALARPLVELHALAKSFVAIRDDRAVVAIDLDGSVLGTVTPEPGERVVTLAVRDDAALAIVEIGGRVRGRWLDLGEGLHWGKATPALAIDANEHAVMTPDHTKLAGTIRHGRDLAVVDLATGKRVDRVTDSAEEDPPLFPIGFVDARTLLYAAQFTTRWWRSGSGDLEEGGGFSALAAPPAVVDGLVVNADGVSLGLDRPERPRQWLGYQIATILGAQPRRDGWVATDGMHAFRVDGSLRLASVFKMPNLGYDYDAQALAVLDGTHVLASGHSSSGEWALYIVDLVHDTTERVMDGSFLAYEPSTNVVAARLATGFALAIYDPGSGTIRAQAVADEPPNTGSELVLQRARRGGPIATLVRFGGDGSGFETQAVLGIKSGTEPGLRLGKVHGDQLPDDFWMNHGDLTGVVAIEPIRATSPDRAWTATLDGVRVTLRDAEGVEKWTVAVPGATGLTWTTTGRLVAIGGGMAELDVASGALGQRQCGWQFGLWDEFAGPFGAGAVCEAP